MRRATLTADEVLLQVTRLAALNAWGQDITVRPADGFASGLVVLDGLGATGLRWLCDEGHVPVVATSTDGPGGIADTTVARTQVWLRLSLDKEQPEVVETAARMLQARYSLGTELGQDPGMVPVGRLAGFIDHGGQGKHGRDIKDGAGSGDGEMHGHGMLVTVRSVSEQPGQMTSAAARVLAEAVERVAVDREAVTDRPERASVETVRWGGHLVGAFAAEMTRENEQTGTVDARPHQRRHAAGGRVSEDDERDGRGGR